MPRSGTAASCVIRTQYSYGKPNPLLWGEMAAAAVLLDALFLLPWGLHLGQRVSTRDADRVFDGLDCPQLRGGRRAPRGVLSSPSSSSRSDKVGR